MAEQLIPTLPTFPTTWGEEETKRLELLKEQKARMDELYKTKFAPEAWARVSVPERFVRGLLPGSVYEPIVRALTPWQFGFEYGVTPEQAKAKMLEAEAEVIELLRMQRVVTVLPSIQNTLRMLALTEATIVMTEEELNEYFKLSKLGFTEEEKGYVADFARSLLSISPEELVSGESIGLRPITPEEIQSLIGGDRPIINPNQILSTVAFSSDLDQVHQALRQAYPPLGGETDVASAKETWLQEYLDVLKSLGVDVKEGETLEETAARAFETQAESKGWAIPTDENGLPLIDPATNQTIVYTIDKDNYAWYGEEIIGYYDEEQERVVPVSLSGEPITTEQQQEGVLKDWWDALTMSLSQSWQMGKQYFLNTLPQMIVSKMPGFQVEGESTISKVLNFSIYKFLAEKVMGIKETDVAMKEKEEELGSRLERYMKQENLSYEQLEGLSNKEKARILFNWTKASMKMEGEKPLPEPDEKVVAYLGMIDDMSNYLERDYLEREQRYVDWLVAEVKEHPELLPRPEWDVPMIDKFKRDPRELLDVGYLGYHMMSNVHTYLAVAASIAVTYVTHNPLAGMATAVALFTPLETESLKRDLIDSGATYDQASTLAAPAGALISSMESIGNIPILKAFAPQFFTAFKKNLTRGLVATIVKYGLITPAKITASETLEEILQEAAHNAFVKTVDEDRHLLENVPEVVLQSIVAMAPLAFMGGGAEYINMKNRLPPDVRDKLDSDSQTYQDTGIPKDQADLIAYNKLTETETGRATVEAAYGEINAELPHPAWDTYTGLEATGMTWEEWSDNTASSSTDFSDKITNLEGQLETINSDIDNFTQLLKDRVAKLAKAEELGEGKAKINELQEMVKYLEDQLAELEISRDTLIANVIDARRALAEFNEVPQVELEAVTPEVTTYMLDPEVVDLVKELNKANLFTLSSHAGSSEISPRGYVVFNRNLSPNDIAKFKKIASKYNLKNLDIEVSRVGAPDQTAIHFGSIFKGGKPNSVEVELPKTWGAISEVTPEAVIGIPMPESSQQELLTQADAWLDQAGKREPNALHVLGISEGEALVRTDSEGKPMMVVTLHMREGKLTLDTIVAAEPGKIANGKALLDIINYLEKRDIAFPPEAEMSPTAIKIYHKIMAKMAAKKEGELAPTEAHFEETPTVERAIKLPRMVSWTKEQEATDMALRTHPEIARNMKVSKSLQEARARAEREWLATDEDARLVIAKKFRLHRAFIAKDWSGMSSLERGLLTTNAIPDGSIHFKMIKEVVDMEEFLEYLEEAVDLPFLPIYRRATRGKSVGDAIAEYLIKEIKENPIYREILKSDAQKAIVAQELNARNEIQGVEHPENLTEEQLALVDELQAKYDSYMPFARYMEFMREKPSLATLKERFPDAVEAGKESELVTALELRNKGDHDALWQFLHGCTWGVIERGYDPRQTASPDLRTKEVTMGTVRGASSLEQRTRIEFPEGRFRRDVIARLIAYITQMEIQWNIEPELRNFQKLWDIAYWKFENKDEVKSVMNRWWGKMQGIPSQYGWFGMIAKRVWRQSMTSIFWEPILALRNSYQALNLHMDRSELIRTLVRPHEMSLRQRIRSKRYYDIFVSQLGGLRKYILLVGQPGLPGLGKVNQLADTLNLYGWSDYIPRFWSFKSYLNKATRATNQFVKDGNVAKWIKNSGAMHLRQTERNYVLSTYLTRLQDTFNLQVDALEDVTGAEMAAFYVAQRNTDRTHFKYRRELRGGVEMGVLGETLFNLFVFPRGYGQRVYFQAEKIGSLFKGEATWEEARSGFNDLLKLFIVAQLFSGFWKGLTGRKRNPYDPMNILSQWTFGGLFVGSMIELTDLIGDAVIAVTPWTDPTLREQAQGRMPGRLSDLGELLVPFYRRVIDIWAALEDTPDQDVYWLRKMRELWDETYTEEELEKLDMTLWEKMKKAVLGATPTDPDVLEKAQTALQEARDRLGTRDVTGKYFTLRDYGNTVASLTKGFPDIFTSSYSGSHELDIFFKDCEAQWEEYYLLPTSPSSIRKDWRLAHPEEEAMMLFWGKFSQSVFPMGSLEWEEVAGALLLWFSQYRIDQTMHPEWANWGLDLMIPPRK